jgi:hypothetical protein
MQRAFRIQHEDMIEFPVPIGLTTFESAQHATVGAATDRGIVDLGGLVPGTCQQDMPAVLIDEFDEPGTNHEGLMRSRPARL